MNLMPLFKSSVASITIAAISGSFLLASETEKSIFKGNQAKIPDFSILENQQKASIIESQNPSVFNNNLELPSYIHNRPIQTIPDTNDKSLEKKQKNWLYDEVEKIKEARLERSNPKDEKPSYLPESHYKKPDIFSLGINQGISQSIHDSFKTTAISQQVSSIDFKPAIFESSLNSGRNLSNNESILGTSSSLQIGLQNIHERPSNRGMLDTSSPPLLDDNLATKLNSPINDFTNLKANSATPHLPQSSMLPSQNFKINPLNLNASNSLQNLSDLNKTLNSDSFSNPFSSNNSNINKLLTPSTNTSPKVFGNPNLNPNKIQDPLERLYR